MDDAAPSESLVREADRLLSHYPSGVMIVGSDGIILWANAPLCEVLNVTAAQLVGGRCLVSTADNPDEQPLSGLFAATNQAGRQSLVIKSRDHRRLSISLKAAAIRDQDGCLLAAVFYQEEPSSSSHDRENGMEQLHFMQNLIDAVPSPLYFKDKNGVYRLCNKAFEQQLSRPRHEIIGKRNEDLWAMEVAELLEERDRELLVHPGVEMNEISLQHRNGAAYEALVSRATMTDGAGQIQGIIGVTHDITGRKRAEHALAESEGRYRLLFESAADAIFIHQNNEPFLAVNEAGCRLLEMDRQEIWLKSFGDLAAEHDRPIIAEELAAVPEEGSYVFETTLIRGDGEPVPVEISSRKIDYARRRATVSFVRDISKRKKNAEEQERFVAMLVESHDRLEELNDQLSRSNDLLRQEIADRRKAEEALAASEDRYRLLVDNAPYMVAVVQDEQLVFINQTGAGMLGATDSTAIIGQPVTGFLHANDAGQVTGALTRAIAEREQINLSDIVLIRMDKAEIIVELVALPTDFRGKTAAQLIIHDITERRRSEAEREKLGEQLRQAQKMESIGRLAGGVAHDFNNILTGIIGYLDLLLGGQETGADSREILQEIRKAAERAGQITQQLLGFSRRQMISPRVLDLNQTISKATRMLRRIIGEDIQLLFEAGEKLHSVFMDEGQIEQILINLAVNSRDAMPHGGTVAIATKNEIIDDGIGDLDIQVQPGRYVVVSVYDNGEGMPPDVQEKIFEPFFTTKDIGKGTGLGLSMGYGIMKQNKGFVEVHSDPGKGTAFHLHFPAAGAAIETPTVQHTEAPPRGNETILVVEDEEIVRELAHRILEIQGYRVLVAENGEAALEVAQRHREPIDLVLTDVVMPKMNGMRLAERLWTEHPDLKVLFMSGYTEELIDRHGPIDQQTDFIAKPFTLETLTNAIRNALDGKKSS